MPRKIKTSRRGRPKKTAVSAPAKMAEQHSSKWFHWGESYSSFMMGIIVVIIAFLFIGSFAKLRHTQQTSSTSIVDTNAVNKALDETQGGQTKLSAPSQKTYVVQEGDYLYSIAQKFYQDGDKWVDIAKANSIDNPDTIFAGTKLVIPNIPPANQVSDNSQATPDNAIKGNTYTVQSGESLWDIAVRAYADGYKWVDIAKANNLSNPDMIFSGNILTLPR